MGLMTRYLLLFDSYVLFCGASSLTRGRGCLLYMLWTLPGQSFSGPSPLGLATIFYCLKFETSLFVASYDSQGHLAYGLQENSSARTPRKTVALLLRFVYRAIG
jgi:hypothetical protein